MPLEPLTLTRPATAANFDEAAYLESNPDVRRAVERGEHPSGRHHFDVAGYLENRTLRFAEGIEAMRTAKLRRLRPLLRHALPHQWRGAKCDFLTAELRTEAAICDTDNISGGEYHDGIVELIGRCRDGLVLDCGAGRRPTYYPNVVNFEIVDYDTTDVVGVGEVLPFVDNSFDAVLSIAVLEHVRDPFRCAGEIARVLKPGGALVCTVPFLQPLHAYPHHYFNMTHLGARALFEPALVIDDMPIDPSSLPVNALAWIISAWSAGLAGEVREAFLDMPLRELLTPAAQLLDRPWVTMLSPDKNRELAHGTYLQAHKPQE